ncbi:MAG: MASE1 domain-containing protein [Cyclobacteriaceae bacterium]|nr:MASE1 domain-containing protein [Cyclobacteriaceae bacterium]
MSELKLNFELPLKYLKDIKIVTVAGLYFGAAWVGYFLAFPASIALPVWPASGVAFALIILLGREAWPGITLGALLANLLAYWNHADVSQTTLILVSTFIAIGQTIELLMGNWLIKRWIKDYYPFRRTMDSFRFLFVVLAISLVGSWISTVSLYWNGILSTGVVSITAWRSWASDVVGILLFTPLILSFSQLRKSRIQGINLMEGTVFVLVLVSIYTLIQGGYYNATVIDSLPFLFIPLLLWLAFRFNLSAAMVLTMTASLVAVYFTSRQQGPFIQADVHHSMLLLQIFISVVSVSTIILSATVSERAAAQEELKRFNHNLEFLVRERTHALKEEIETRKNTEGKLIQTNQELSKRNTELDNFVYSVSHDLRAPIASVLGLINLARKDKVPAMKDVYLEKIYHSALQQDNFIREILDQSRNSRLEVKKDEIQFESLIDETFNQLKFATATGTAVEKIVIVKQPQTFYSDRWRLKVILNNIISNAIRYRNGHDPVIKVNVVINDHKAVVEIEDNGRGIPKEHLHKVCQMFYRATDDGAGSGLGLYIVKETMDKLHGMIDIESEVGKGTKVKLEIPELH